MQCVDKSTVKSVRSWRQVLSPQHWAFDENKAVAIEATYADGSVRTLRPRFRDRDALLQYVYRFLPGYVGKECGSIRRSGIPRLEHHQAARLAAQVRADFSFVGPKGRHWTWDMDADRPYPASVYGINQARS